jgi:cysteinyl-tRNA synthetase
MHNGYLMSEGEKMSKSLGNFYSVNELLAEFPGEALRLVLLQTHYRAPLDFTKDGVRQAKATLDRMYAALRNTPATETAEQLPERVQEALEDELNTPLALAGLHEAVTALNAAAGDEAKRSAKRDVLAAGSVLGLLQDDPETWFRWQAAGEGGLDDEAIDDLVAQRTEARKSKDFAESDRIRDVLTEAGVVLEDKPEGTIWRRG